MRGSVRIESNLSLCFAETIDWSKIISKPENTVIKNNKAADECQTVDKYQHGKNCICLKFKLVSLN